MVRDDLIDIPECDDWYSLAPGFREDAGVTFPFGSKDKGASLAIQVTNARMRYFPVPHDVFLRLNIG